MDIDEQKGQRTGKYTTKKAVSVSLASKDYKDTGEVKRSMPIGAQRIFGPEEFARLAELREQEAERPNRKR